MNLHRNLCTAQSLDGLVCCHLYNWPSLITFPMSSPWTFVVAFFIIQMSGCLDNLISPQLILDLIPPSTCGWPNESRSIASYERGSIKLIAPQRFRIWNFKNEQTFKSQVFVYETNPRFFFFFISSNNYILPKWIEYHSICKSRILSGFLLQ